ncbi:hypothetical protein G7Y89_g6706 [Cudoniella acicularis]|uniref:Uncharacterized protein n=1 Tax=Cudoniella acicularis TaxID=354080 RepID=A0A8H4RJX7_9HELO|nr:hypothetical protein G7Y89_g6706 [Cudoniella acicularis]
MRILLEKGVDANARTRGLVPVTPLELCVAVSSSSSREMWATLLEYDAKANALPTDSSIFILDTELLNLVLGRKPESADNNSNDAILVATMHRLLAMCVTRYPLTLEAFRVALSWGRELILQCVNSPDQHGLAMLQCAAGSLKSEAVKLLLDAGADARIPFMAVDEAGEAPIAVLPLQVSCYCGKYWPFLIGELDTYKVATARRTEENIRADALEIAMELLRWHEARGDGLFEGITEPHLTFHMCMLDEVQRLIDRRCNKMAKGSWPGVEGRFTPKELLDIDDTKEVMAARQCIKTIHKMTSALTAYSSPSGSHGSASL